jgi:hypothetical protein
MRRTYGRVRCATRTFADCPNQHISANNGADQRQFAGDNACANSVTSTHGRANVICTCASHVDGAGV